MNDSASADAFPSEKVDVDLFDLQPQQQSWAPDLPAGAMTDSGPTLNLDPLTIRLQNVLEAGILASDDFMYVFLSDALSFATSIGKRQFQWDPRLVSFCETIEFHGKPKVMHLVNGAKASVVAKSISIFATTTCRCRVKRPFSRRSLGTQPTRA